MYRMFLNGITVIKSLRMCSMVYKILAVLILLSSGHFCAEYVRQTRSTEFPLNATTMSEEELQEFIDRVPEPGVIECRTGEDYMDDMKNVRHPTMKILCPTANETFVGYYDWRNVVTWCDFHDRPGNTYPEFNESSKGLNQSLDYIHYLLHEEINNGIPPEQIIIGGYSLGGAIAIHAALSFPKKLGGIATLSTWLPDIDFLKKTYNSVNKNIPVLLCHIYDDPHTFVDSSRLTAYHLNKTVTRDIVLKYFNGEFFTNAVEYAEMKKFVHNHTKP